VLAFVIVEREPLRQQHLLTAKAYGAGEMSGVETALETKSDSMRATGAATRTVRVNMMAPDVSQGF